MSFMEYAQQTQSNIIPKEEFDLLLKEVFDVISTNMAKSLGPLGSSATILDGMMTEATKDGYSIMKKYRFHNRYKKMIYNLIIAPCTRMNNTVGDATTTAIVLTSALFSRYTNRSDVLSTLYRLPRQFIKVWDDSIADVIRRVQQYATQIDPDDRETIYNIAYVTSNGNAEISNAIADVYAEAKYPSIKKKDSPTNKSYIQPINGFDFEANLISDVYVRNEDMSATENDIAIMIFDHKVETDIFKNVIVPINEVMRDKKKKLLVLAPFFDALMCETELNQYLIAERRRYGSFNLILAQFAIGKLPPDQLQDLAVVLRAKIFNQNLESVFIENIQNGTNIEMILDDCEEDETSPFYRIIGSAKQAILSCKSGSVFKVEGIEEDEEYQRTLKMAERDLQEIMENTDFERHAYAAKIYNAKARLMQLQMKNYIYYVGADSALQKQILEDSIDDVIKCLRSATKNGVVPGCQLSIMRACNEALAEIEHDYMNDPDNDIQLRVQILGMIRGACTDVYNRIIHGPNGDGIVKTIPGWQYTTEEDSKDITTAAIEKGNNIIRESVKRNEVFDMETLEFNPHIITSAETDTMVLSAASELVKILISGNQCIVLDSDVDESHEEKREIYV